MEIETINRSVKIDLFLTAEHKEQYQRVLSSIRQYRATLRHCFSIFATACAAGASIEWTDDEIRVKPDNAKAKQLLELSTGKSGKALGYELRDHVLRDLCPTWMSFVWDSLRRDLQVAWTAPDPEFPKAKKGWLILQGSRGISQFNRRGIGFPLATGKPKIDGHNLILKWDHAIGAIQFKFGSLDPARWAVLRNLTNGDDGWSIGTAFLSESNGKLFVILSYSCPLKRKEVDPERILRVSFHDSGETLCTLVGPDGDSTFDRLAAAGVEAFLRQHQARKIALESRMASHGSPRRPWGHRKGWLADQNVLSRLTENRERRVKDYNHAWTRRIISRAASWRCGSIVLEKLPETLCGFSWSWFDLKTKLKYKCEEIGASFELAVVA